MKSAVYDATHREFKKCYDSAARKTTKDKAVVFHICVNKMYQKKSESSREHHCPMCVPARNHLNKSVNDSAEKENRKVFSQFVFCQN